MRLTGLLSIIFITAVLAGCSAKPRYPGVSKNKSGMAMLASNEFIPPTFGSPQGAWRVTHIDGKPAAGGKVRFAKGRVSASGGCNGTGGDYIAHADGRVQIRDLSSTLVACVDADGSTNGMELDDLITSRLGDAVKFQKRTSDQLLLTTSDKRSLRMVRLPRPPRSVEGDWMLSGSEWDARDGSTTPKPMAHFHRGRYQDAARCAGRYWQALGYLALKLDQTLACERSALTSGFHRLRSTYNGLALYPRGTSGLLLSPLSSWDVVPSSRWTLEGAWYNVTEWLPRGRTTYRVTFKGRTVTERNGCQGSFDLRGDILSLSFPNTQACNKRARRPNHLESDYAVLPTLPATATLKMRSYDQGSLTFADGKEMWLYRAEPKEQRPDTRQ